MKHQELIGKQVKGFKFNLQQGGIGYNLRMDSYIGKPATITAYLAPETLPKGAFRFKFKNDETFIYPEQMVLDQLEANRELSDDEMKDVQEYIGKEVTGFMFKDTSYVDCGYKHEQYIDEIGKVVEVELDGVLNTGSLYSFRLEFEDGHNENWYPLELIEDHLVDQTPIDIHSLIQQITKQ